MTTTRTQARELSDRYTDAINAHDLDAVLALFAEDATLVDPTGTYTGHERVAEYWRNFAEAFPDMHGTDELKADSGDSAVNEWTFTGTNTGPMETPEGTIPATGRRIEVRGCDVVVARDGLIRSHRVYYDQLAFMAQLGLVPEPAVAG